MEEVMERDEYQSDFAKKLLAQGRVEGRAEVWAWAEARAVAWAKAWVEGWTEGRIEGAAHSLLIVLRARRIAVPDAVRERILAQKDLQRLEHWLDKAAVASSIAAVIDESN
jgi:hypothetical protein